MLVVLVIVQFHWYDDQGVMQSSAPVEVISNCNNELVVDGLPEGVAPGCFVTEYVPWAGISYSTRV